MGPLGYIFLLLFFLHQVLFIYGYDTLDPQGNITITWDILKWQGDTNYDARISIYNYQLFRPVERPGWRLTWNWSNDEVIWKMEGAEAKEQGDCSKFKSSEIPHCCKRIPDIIDLLPGVAYNQQTANCCKGGVLSTMNQDPAKYGSTFMMHVGHTLLNSTEYANITMNGTKEELTTSIMPTKFGLGLPGYSCGKAIPVEQSRFYEDNGRRTTQAAATWNVTCQYSQFRASKAPKCCVSLSAFYNNTITQCPHCSCGCQGLPGTKCVKSGDDPPSWLRLPSSADEDVPPAVLCTHHMCPIRVHWHVKTSYRGYWRVKITITNMNHVKNYSQWSLAVEHPNLQSVVQVFSFNYKPLNQYADTNNTGMFWGIQYYNDMLLQSSTAGNVQTEMVLRKDPEMFTFNAGWAFPKKIVFNGDECVMPPPNDYPSLPTRSFSTANTRPVFLSFILLLVTMILLCHCS